MPRWYQTKMARNIVLVWALLALMLNHVGAQRDPIDGAITVSDEDIRMNQMQMLGSHNSYHIAPAPDLLILMSEMESIAGVQTSAPGLDYTHVSLTQQMDTQNVRHFELDVFADPAGGLFRDYAALKMLNRDTAQPGLDQPGYKVLHIQDIDPLSVCLTLVECLTEIKAWSTANSHHVPMMISIQVSEDPIIDPLALGFTTPVQADLTELEAEIRSVFTVDNNALNASDIIMPNHIMALGNQTDLRTTVTTVGWPTLAQTRGKVIFTLQGPGGINTRYANGDATLQDKLMFVFSEPSSGDCAFVLRNQVLQPQSAGNDISSLVADGYMVRTRTDAITIEARSGETTQRDAAIGQGQSTSGAQYISTDYPATLTAAQVPADIQTGYSVVFKPRCNPVNGPVNCTVEDFVQEPITAPQTPPTLTDGSGLAFESLFSGSFSVNNQTTNFFRNWAKLAGLYTPFYIIDDILSYSIPQYARSSNTDNLHNTPRLYGTDVFGFNSDYVGGLVLIFGPFLLIALILGLLSLFIFFKCGSCPPKCAYRKSRYPTTRKQATCMSGCFVVTLALCLAGAGLAIYGSIMLKGSVTESNETVGKTNAYLGQVEQMSFTAYTSIAEIEGRIDRIQALCPGQVAGDLAGSRSVLQELFQFTFDLYESIEGLPAAITDGQEILENVNTWQFMVIIAFLSVCIVLLLLFTTLLFMGPLGCNAKGTAGKMAKRVTKFFFLPFAAIIMILSIVIVGLMFAVNVGMSDFCYTPDVTVTSVLPDDNTAFVSYYTNCEGENRFLDELNDKGELLSLLNDFNPLLNLSIGLCPIETHDDINLATNSIRREVNATYLLLDDARFFTQCSTINPLYSQLVYGDMCHDMNNALTFLWVGLTMLVIGMLPTLWIFGAIALSEEKLNKHANNHKELLYPDTDPYGYKAEFKADEEQPKRVEGTPTMAAGHTDDMSDKEKDGDMKDLDRDSLGSSSSNEDKDYYAAHELSYAAAQQLSAVADNNAEGLDDEQSVHTNSTLSSTSASSSDSSQNVSYSQHGETFATESSRRSSENSYDSYGQQPLQSQERQCEGNFGSLEPLTSSAPPPAYE